MDNDYMKPQEALGLLCSAIRCGEEFGPAHEKARLSILSALAQAADAGRYREALGEICRDSNPDWTEKRVYPCDVLDDIHAIATGAYFGQALQGEQP